VERVAEDTPDDRTPNARFRQATLRPPPPVEPEDELKREDREPVQPGKRVSVQLQGITGQAEPSFDQSHLTVVSGLRCMLKNLAQHRIRFNEFHRIGTAPVGTSLADLDRTFGRFPTRFLPICPTAPTPT
jgi:hypothetical protein